jgi:hypothetical protein
MDSEQYWHDPFHILGPVFHGSFGALEVNVAADGLPLMNQATKNCISSVHCNKGQCEQSTRHHVGWMVTTGQESSLFRCIIVPFITSSVVSYATTIHPHASTYPSSHQVVNYFLYLS